MSVQEKIQKYLLGRVDPEGQNKLYPVVDWARECEEGDTSLGYVDWVSHAVEEEAIVAVETVLRLMHRTVHCYLGDIDEISFNDDVLDLLGDLRMLDDEAADRARQFLQLEQERGVFGETYGLLPPDMALDASRLCHYGMIAFEGRGDITQVDRLILMMAIKYGFDGEVVDATRTRMDDASPSP